MSFASSFFVIMLLNAPSPAENILVFVLRLISQPTATALGFVHVAIWHIAATTASTSIPRLPARAAGWLRIKSPLV